MKELESNKYINWEDWDDEEYEETLTRRRRRRGKTKSTNEGLVEIMPLHRHRPSRIIHYSDFYYK